jgi:peptidoglycan-associated lipoprotein
MARISAHLRAFGAILALGVLAGCAGQATAPPPQPQADVKMAPELAGAWYQVFFDSNKTDIDARGQLIVTTVADVVKNVPTTRVTVIGRTDRVGSAPANMVLSQQRADRVRDALVAAGVPATLIVTRWTGENRQRVATANDTDEPGNRVVDITVVKQAP